MSDALATMLLLWEFASSSESAHGLRFSIFGTVGKYSNFHPASHRKRFLQIFYFQLYLHPKYVQESM